MPFAHIKVEGLDELQRAIKRRAGKLPTALGEAHKDIGRFVISKLPPSNPNAVGKGASATVRPSASKRDVLLRVGHGARKAAFNQWGTVPVMPPAPGPDSRPHIVGAIRDNQDDIEEMFRKEVTEILAPAFYSAD